MTAGPWSRRIRDRWFFVFLGLSFAAVVLLFWPYLFVLVFAATTAVVTWPLHEVVLRRTGGRPALAAVLTLLLLLVLVLGPLGLVVYLAVLEGITLVRAGVDLVASGRAEAWLFEQLDRIRHRPWLNTDWINRFVGEEFDLVQTLIEPLRAAVLGVGSLLTAAVPGLLNRLVAGGIDGIIFVFTLLTLYMEGPRFLRFLAQLLPMDDRYEARLFDVFREFANNMVLGSLATGALQGIVAGVGYAIAGVDRVAFLGLLTGVLSFVPLVGTALVWVPVAIWVFATQGVGWGVFVVAWSVLLTGTVDNFAKPLFLRGSSDIHPLLIFLAVFGGLFWMGVPGVLVGPVIVASFLALYTIHVRDFLDAVPITDEGAAQAPGGRRPDEAHEDVEPPSGPAEPPGDPDEPPGDDP